MEDALNSGQLDTLLNVLGVPHLGSLLFIVSFGIGIGLSIGLYEMLKPRWINSSSYKQNTSEMAESSAEPYNEPNWDKSTIVGVVESRDGSLMDVVNKVNS